MNRSALLTLAFSAIGAVAISSTKTVAAAWPLRANVPIPGPVASGAEWYPNFAEHWLFWLAFGLSVDALIFVSAAIRRRFGRQVGASLETINAREDALEVGAGTGEK
jgi:hypothetical protein